MNRLRMAIDSGATPHGRRSDVPLRHGDDLAVVPDGQLLQGVHVQAVGQRDDVPVGEQELADARVPAPELAVPRASHVRRPLAEVPLGLPGDPGEVPGEVPVPDGPLGNPCSSRWSKRSPMKLQKSDSTSDYL